MTFAQTQNIWHDDVTNHDDPETLTTTVASGLQLVQTVTDADGDSDSAALNLGANVFAIQDDGPDAVVGNATAAAIVLDETRPLGTDSVAALPRLALRRRPGTSRPTLRRRTSGPTARAACRTSWC